MAFTVEDGTGLSDANAYISVAEFKAYHDERGNSYEAACKDSTIQQAIIRATDYIEKRWRNRWKGVRESEAQALAFPRVYLFDEDGYVIDGIPAKLKQATAEYAVRAITITLMPDPQIDDTSLRVRRKREKVGPIETETEFAEEAPRDLRPYPAADRLLIDYVTPAGRTYRA